MSALNVSPDLVPKDLADVFPTNAVFSRQVLVSYPFASMTHTNFTNLIDRNLSHALRWATHMLRGDRPSNVHPLFARNDSPDGRNNNTVHGGKFFLAIDSIGVQVPHFDNLRFREFCHAMQSTHYVCLASLLHHVLHVVFGCASKQMLWIAAKRRIAIMAAQLIVRNRSINQFVGDTMRGKHLARILEFTVSLNNGSLPQPAFVWAKNLYMRPEALHEVNRTVRDEMTNKILGLAVRILGYFERLTTTTLTQWGKMKFELREIRGMIHGGNSPFATLLTSQDGSTHRWDNFIGCYSTNYSTFGRVLQPIEGVV